MIHVKDMVNHPSHYQSKNGLEAWDVIKEFTSDLSGAEAWGTQQALKYLLRWKHKNGKEDLEKAIVYIQELIKDIERQEDIDFEEYFLKHMNRPIEDDPCDGCKHAGDESYDDYNKCSECKRFVNDSDVDHYDPLKECLYCMHNEESFVQGCNDCNPLTKNNFEKK